MTDKEQLLANLHALSPEQRQALAVLLKRRGIDVADQLPIPRRERAGPSPLSHGQLRLWFLARLEPESSGYHLSDAVVIEPGLDRAALQKTVDALVARHASLRTSFHESDGKPGQILHESMAVPVQWLEPDVADAEALARARSLVEDLESKPFDLSTGPLLRVCLIGLPDGRQVLAWVLHHIIADEWSMNIFINEFVAFYQAYRQGLQPELPELALSYADFAAWQRDWLEAGEQERQLAYWQAKLGSETPTLALPFDRQRPAELSGRGAKLEAALPEQTAAALHALCRQQGVTPFMVLLALFTLLLYRYCGQHTIRVGVPVAGRNRRETEALIGFFVNTLVYQTELHGGLNFRQVLARVKDTALDAQAHADLPFDQLVEALSPERGLDRNPLFQVMYNHQYRQADTERALGEFKLEPLARATRTTQFELILDTFADAGGGIAATVP